VDFGHWSVRDAVAELLDQHLTAGFPGPALAAGMLRLLGGDMASFVEAEVGRPYGTRLGYAPYDIADRFPAQNVGALMATHPVHHHYPATLSLRAERVTDFVPRATWRRSLSYRLLSSHLGVRYQLIVPLAVSARRYCILSVYRTDRDFRDGELDAAAHVQPVLIGLRTLVTQAPRIDTPEPIKPLTARELDVLELMTDGLTAHAIGHRLHISSHTAARHIEAIYMKLGTHDRATTALRAQRLGLLPD
jgi:DNA-binding CsgD family transcriptional regulator